MPKGTRGKAVCSIDGCDRNVHGRGLCGKHYQRRTKHGHTDDPPPLPVGCSVDGCDGDRYARGWCFNHYQRWWKTGVVERAVPTTEERFWSKVDKDGPLPKWAPFLGPCWLWTAGLFPEDYGCFKLDGKSRLTHRLSYEWLVGPIPDGLELDHLCRVRPCCNPDHLEPVTSAENIYRARLAA